MKTDLGKIESILEYNPIYGNWHYNPGTYPTNTNSYYQISPKMEETYFPLFAKLMGKRFEIKDTKEDKKHVNPTPETIKKEFELFMDTINEILNLEE